MKTRFTLFLALTLSLTTVFTNCKKDGTNPIQFNVFSIEDDKKMGLEVSQQIDASPALFPQLKETQYATAYGHLRRITNEILNNAVIYYFKFVLFWIQY